MQDVRANSSVLPYTSSTCEASLEDLDWAGETGLFLTTLGIMFIYRNRVTEVYVPFTAIKHNFKDRNPWQDRLAGLRKDQSDSASYHLTVIKPCWNWYLCVSNWHDAELNLLFVCFTKPLELTVSRTGYNNILDKGKIHKHINEIPFCL